jgi:O-antigen ligase
LSILVLASLLVVVAANEVLGIEGILRALLRAAVIGASLSLILLLARYGPAVDPAFGTLRGPFVQKNVLARQMSVGLACMAVLLVSQDARRRRLLAGGLLCGVCLVFAGSSTGLVSAVLAVGVVVWVLIRKLLAAQLVIAARFFLVGIVCVVLMFFVLREIVDAVFSMTGRDPTFTARVPIWSSVMNSIEVHPVVGYGLDAFWSIEGGPSLRILDETGFSFVPHAHNGILDLALGVGWLGVGLVLVALIRSGLTLLRISVTADSLLLVAGLSAMWTLILLVNITESQLLSRLGALTPAILYVIIVSPGISDGRRSVSDFRPAFNG